MANILSAVCDCPEYGGSGHCPITTVNHRVPGWATLPKHALVAKPEVIVPAPKTRKED